MSDIEKSEVFGRLASGFSKDANGGSDWGTAPVISVFS
jgi:hypothetical protein